MEGGEEGGEGTVQGPTSAARGLWVGLQYQQKRTRYLCGARTWESHSHGRYTVRQSLHKVFRVVSHRPLNGALNRIVLTFKYAENVDYVPGQGGRWPWREWQGPRCNSCGRPTTHKATMSEAGTCQGGRPRPGCAHPFIRPFIRQDTGSLIKHRGNHLRKTKQLRKEKYLAIAI